MLEIILSNFSNLYFSILFVQVSLVQLLIMKAGAAYYIAMSAQLQRMSQSEENVNLDEKDQAKEKKEEKKVLKLPLMHDQFSLGHFSRSTTKCCFVHNTRARHPSASPIIAITAGCDSTASNRYCSRQITTPPFFPALPVILAVVITREEVWMLRLPTSFEVVPLVFGLVGRVKALAPARIKSSWTKAEVAVIIKDLERQRSSSKYVDRSPRPSQIITGLD